MTNHIAHFAIHADDPERAKRFYETVFGWNFQPWGPPDFWLIRTGETEGAIHGSLQRRQTPASDGGLNGFECTVSVDSVDAIAEAVRVSGGTIVTPKMQINGVGWLVQFRDPEGNLVSVMRYEAE